MAWTSLSGNKAIVKKPYLEQEIKLLPAGSKWFSSYIWISLKFDLTRVGHFEQAKTSQDQKFRLLERSNG